MVASAVAVVAASSHVVMEADGGYIDNRTTGERIPLCESRRTSVFDIVPTPPPGVEPV